MKTKFFTIDFIKEEIRGSERAFNRAGRGFELEYKELITLINEHPEFELIVTEPEKKKVTYEGLDIPFMSEYISINDSENLSVFEKLKETNKFPTVRRWFLETYKDDTGKFNVKKEKEKINKTKTESAISEAKKVKLISVKPVLKNEVV